MMMETAFLSGSVTLFRSATIFRTVMEMLTAASMVRTALLARSISGTFTQSLRHRIFLDLLLEEFFYTLEPVLIAFRDERDASAFLIGAGGTTDTVVSET